MSFIHSIKFRFTIWYLIVLAILLGTLSFGVYFYLSRSLYRSLDNSLELRSNQICSVPPLVESIWSGEFQEKLGEIVMLYFYTGSQLVEVSPSSVNASLSHQFIYQAINGRSSFTTVEDTEGQQLRLLAVPIHLGIPGMPLSTQPGALIVGRSTRQIDQALQELVRTLAIAVPLALAVAAGGGIFLARRALKPVDKIAHTAQEIEENDLSQRINVNTRDELGRLAATLNAMIGRLERAFQRQKQFTSDASHELRAPLAVIEAESSLALQKERPPSDYRQSLETISQESRRMSSLIEQLLTLARADAGKEQWNFTEVNLGRLITDLSADVEVLCHEKGITCQLGQIQDLVINGDEARLRELFMNLLDNAIRYTPSRGSVSISLHREAQMAVVAITDTGVGIPTAEMAFIFERFYRADKSRSRAEQGTGLGLAICRHIAEAHGGKIEVESQVGVGSTFSVRLPLLSP